MGRKKKKKPLPPRCKRMKRPARQQSAKAWLVQYTGKNILRGYCKHFAVDWRCAAIELKQLGVHLDPKYLKQREVTEQQLSIARKKRRQTRNDEALSENWYEYDYGSPWDAYLAEDYAAMYDMQCKQDATESADDMIEKYVPF